MFNPNIIARDLGLKESITNEHTGTDGGAIEVKPVNDRELARQIAFALSKGATLTQLSKSSTDDQGLESDYD